MTSKSARFVPSIRLSQYNVVNKKGDDMGQVQTFIIDMHEGLIAFALVAFGGFLGITDKVVCPAVDCSGVAPRDKELHPSDRRQDNFSTGSLKQPYPEKWK